MYVYTCWLLLLCSIVFCFTVYTISICNAIASIFVYYLYCILYHFGIHQQSHCCYVTLYYDCMTSIHHIIYDVLYFHDTFCTNDLNMTPSSPAIGMLTCLYFQVQHDRCFAFRLWQTCQEDAPQQGGDLEVM